MSDELDRREPEGKTEKTTTRRDFLVGLKGAVLPSLAVLGLGALLQGCGGGGGGCKSCASNCSGGCGGSCVGGCSGGCHGGCQGGCYSSNW